MTAYGLIVYLTFSATLVTTMLVAAWRELGKDDAD